MGYKDDSQLSQYYETAIVILKGVCFLTDIDTLLISPRHNPLMTNTFPVGRGHSYTDRNQKNLEKPSVSTGPSTDFVECIENPNLVTTQEVSVTLD